MYMAKPFESGSSLHHLASFNDSCQCTYTIKVLFEKYYLHQWLLGATIWLLRASRALLTFVKCNISSYRCDVMRLVVFVWICLGRMKSAFRIFVSAHQQNLPTNGNAMQQYNWKDVAPTVAHSVAPSTATPNCNHSNGHTPTRLC